VTPPPRGVVLTGRETDRIIACLRLMAGWLAGSGLETDNDLRAYLRRPGAGTPAAHLAATNLSAPGLSALLADACAMLRYRQDTGGTP